MFGGVDPDVTDKDGNTALAWCMFNEFKHNISEIIPLIKLLLSFGASVTMPQVRGMHCVVVC